MQHNGRTIADSGPAGVFQAYYDTALPASSSSRISWIGSLQLCIFIVGTSVVGPIYDIGYLRSLLSTGTLLTVFGMMMTSLGSAYWQFLLAQGVCMGLGMTCLFVPCVAVLPPYFSSRRALAMGLAASGSSIGIFCYSHPHRISQLTTEKAPSSSQSSSNRLYCKSASAGPPAVLASCSWYR